MCITDQIAGKFMRRSTCFIAGNIWLLVSLTLILGKKTVRYSPDRYAFFGVGGWLSPPVYGSLIFGSMLIGIALLFYGKCSKQVIDTE
jgi:hypothetical protein